MQTITTIAEMQDRADTLRGEGRSIAFVPTMGYLHEGHLDLIRRARREAEVVVASVFVNPTQFAPGEDLERYPRNMEQDAALARQEGCDILFTPSAEDMYPPGFRTSVRVTGWSDMYEGAVRPTHFEGVATVVTKLFNIVRPHYAVFGQKDAQQAILLRRMVRDLNMGIELIVVPTRREADGLAMSSRNTYLSTMERRQATVLSRALFLARDAFVSGERSASALRRIIEDAFASEPGAHLEYVAIIDERTLEEIDVTEASTMIALAARVGATRLIDNVRLSVQEKS